jgi:hypothetical protein
MRKFAWAFWLVPFAATAHTWTFNQDGSIETQNGIWTFKKGGRMDAEFVQIKGTNLVVLRRSDGAVCDIPLAVLSEKDQDFVLHPPEDTRPQEKPNPVNEAAKIERYWRSHALNVVDEIEEADFPRSDKSQAVCNDIVADMQQLTNALQDDLAYAAFADLLQKQALAVEKLKEPRDTLPRSFLHHTDEFFRFMMNSRDEWSDELKGEAKDYKEYRAFLRKRGWAQAKVHFLYCEGIAAKSPRVLGEIIDGEAAIIQSEQRLARKKQSGSPYPLLHAMSLTEISDRLRAERIAVLSPPN